MIDLMPACDRMIEMLAGVADDRLDDATVCAEYTVGGLIDHVDQVSRGSAALARKDPDAADTELGAATAGDGWRDGVAGHLRALGEAWQDPAAWEGGTAAGGVELPNEVWGKIALTEVVVHGWDIARATGLPFDLDEETLRACLDHVVAFVPNAPVPELWGPAVEVPAGVPLLDRVVAVTGRTP